MIVTGQHMCSECEHSILMLVLHYWGGGDVIVVVLLVHDMHIVRMTFQAYLFDIPAIFISQYSIAFDKMITLETIL